MRPTLQRFSTGPVLIGATLGMLGVLGALSVLSLAFVGGVAGDGAVGAGAETGTEVEIEDPITSVGSPPELGAHPSSDSATDTDVLENESGTTQLVVRFTPIGEPDNDGEAVIDELRDHASEERETFETFADSHPAVTVDRTFWLANAVLVTVDADEVEITQLLTVENVTHVHENAEIRTFTDDGTVEGVVAERTPEAPAERKTSEGKSVAGKSVAGNEPISSTHGAEGIPDEYTPGLGLIAAPDAWNRFDTRGAGATVVVIDSGVDPSHQDIDLAGWASFDENGTLVSDDVADASDPIGHGTHVAGTVAGGDASGTHIGVAPDASLIGMDVFGDDGMATFASVLAAMQRATADEDVDVLQMSLGGTGTFNAFIAPVRNARAADKIVVVAAGNEGHGTSSSPANIYDSLAVGAVDREREVADFSSGETITKRDVFREPPEEWPDTYLVPDVTAPGVRVLSAEAGTTDGYITQRGTSMAAPHVSGVAALAVSATDGRIGSDELFTTIVDGAIHPTGASEPDDRYGYGIVDAEATVGAALVAAPAPTPTPSPTEAAPTIEPVATGDDDAPGFGVGIAVFAVLSALVAARAVSKDLSTGT